MTSIEKKLCYGLGPVFFYTAYSTRRNLLGYGGEPYPKLEHLEDFIPVLEMTLTDEMREACDNLIPPGSAGANFHSTAGWMKGQILKRAYLFFLVRVL